MIVQNRPNRIGIVPLSSKISPPPPGIGIAIAYSTSTQTPVSPAPIPRPFTSAQELTSAIPATTPLDNASAHSGSRLLGLGALGRNVGSALGGPAHVDAALAGSQLQSPSSPSAAYRLQNTYDESVPVAMHASVPASDFFAPKRVPEKGSLGVYLPYRRPNTEALVSHRLRITIDRQAMSARA